MLKMMLSFAAVVAAIVLPQVVRAEGPRGPMPPDPEMLFRHLDADHDGVISEDEIPADAPGPLKELLKGADKNGDKKVSLEEFKAMVKEHPPVMPPFGMPMPDMAMPGMQMPGMPGGMMPPMGPGGPAVGCMPGGPMGFPHSCPADKEPDLKALFAKMDKSSDGTLTVEEFAAGMKALHEEMKSHRPPMGQMPGPGMPMHGMMPGMAPPPFPMPPMTGPHSGLGPGMMGPPMPGDHGVPFPAKALDARLSDLETRLKALEAKK